MPVVCFLATLGTGCPPAEVDQNEAVSFGEGRPSALTEMQSETSSVQLLLGRPGGGFRPRLVVGYNDFTDMVTTDDALVDQYSLMGYATRDADGVWQPRAQLAAVEPIDALDGDPWLATDRLLSVVYYSGLARVDDPKLDDALAVSRSVDGAESWEPLAGGFLPTAGQLSYFKPPEGTVDKPSLTVGARRTDLHVAYINHRAAGSFVQVATIERRGAGLSFADATSDGLFRNPLVQADEQSSDVFVVYQTIGEEGDPSAIRIAISTDGARTFPTTADIDTAVRPSEQIDGAFGLQLRNLIFTAYVFDSVEGRHYVAYEDGGTVLLRVSLDGLAWPLVRQLSPSVQGFAFFQPALATARGRTVVTFYQQNLANDLTQVAATISDDGGLSWSGLHYLVRDEAGAVTAGFVPCVSQIGYFGDYNSIVQFPDLAEAPTFYATWADSRLGCEVAGTRHVVHQHVMGAAFR